MSHASDWLGRMRMRTISSWSHGTLAIGLFLTSRALSHSIFILAKGGKGRMSNATEI